VLLHIQRFEEWDDGNNFGGGFPNGGSWKPVAPAPADGGGNNGNDAGGRFFIQKGSKMNNGEFDEGFESNDPF
jgi:replicative DNA helicase